MKIDLNDNAFAGVVVICIAIISWAFAWGSRK